MYAAGSLIQSRSAAVLLRGLGAIAWLVYFSGLGAPMLGASFCVFAFFDLFSQVEAENKNLQRVAISIPSIATLGLTWMAFGDGIADSFIFFSFVCLTLTALFLEGQQKHKISFLLFYAPVAAYCYVLPRSLSGLIFCIVMGFLGLLFSIKIYEEVKATPST